jgi:hypothetical protein
VSALPSSPPSRAARKWTARQSPGVVPRESEASARSGATEGARAASARALRA